MKKDKGIRLVFEETLKLIRSGVGHKAFVHRFFGHTGISGRSFYGAMITECNKDKE